MTGMTVNKLLSSIVKSLNKPLNDHIQILAIYLEGNRTNSGADINAGQIFEINEI